MIEIQKQIAGRYPDEAFPKTPLDRAKEYFTKAERLVEWLKTML